LRWISIRHVRAGSAQQHVDRAAAAVDRPCADIGKHVAPTAQPAVEQALEHGAAVGRAVALAVDDAHAAKIALLALGKEPRDCELRLRAVEAVQVEIALDAIVAAAQPAQHAVLHTCGPVLQGLAVLKKFRIRLVQQFAQHGAVVGFTLQRPRFGPARREGDARRRPARPHALHRLPEQLAVVVHRYLLYKVAPSVAPPLKTSTPKFSGWRAAGLINLHEPDSPLMKILLSNDDGCTAPGLLCLRDELRGHHQVTVVAPDRNRSGASNSLTLMHPLRVQRHADGTICVDGTPTDCVHLALSGLLDEQPDMVVSGINAGANLGDDTLYSGTVAAAMEGRHLGYSAIAVSNVSITPRHYETAARVALRLIERLQAAPLPGDTILNVNVPDVPLDELRGFEVTRLGNRHRAEEVFESKDPRGRQIWWIGAAGSEADCGPGTDFHAITQHRVAITPLLVDLTRHSALRQLDEWARAL
jgi:5'-nucleotidase